LEFSHLFGGHEAGVVVLMPGKRQTEAFNGVSDEGGRLFLRRAMECLKHSLKIMAAEIGHQRVQRIVVARGQQRPDPGDGPQIADQMLPPRAPPL
jgi:hypothetical protein